MTPEERKKTLGYLIASDCMVHKDEITRLRTALATARNDALEEAANVAETCEWWVNWTTDDEREPIAAAIRALQEKP